MFKISTIFTILMFSCLAYPASLSNENRQQLHEVSKSIENHVQYDLLHEYFYNERRSMLRVMDESLTPEQVDSKFRNYIKQKYVPNLIRKYQVAYEHLLDSKLDFCKKKSPVEVYPKVREVETDRYNYGFQMSLCAYPQDDMLIVDYYTRVDNDGLQVTTRYFFQKDEKKKLMLNKIDEVQYVSIPLFIEGI